MSKDKEEQYFKLSWQPNYEIDGSKAKPNSFQKLNNPNNPIYQSSTNQPEFNNVANIQRFSHLNYNQIQESIQKNFNQNELFQYYYKDSLTNQQKKESLGRLNQQNPSTIESKGIQQNQETILKNNLDIPQPFKGTQSVNSLSPQQKNIDPQNQNSIKLNIRSQLIRRSRKYQISTNNAHKKYINCLKNLFFQALSQIQITQFQSKYIRYKSNRVFFFIILVYVKYRFTYQLGQAVKFGFEKQMNQRIKQYEDQIYRCSDFMLKNYRYQEIHEIQIALKAILEFYQGNTAEAVQYLYRKDKHIIVKQNNFRTSLKYIQELEKQFSKNEEQKISKPVAKEHYHRSRFHNQKIAQKQQKTKRLIQKVHFKHEMNQNYKKYGEIPFSRNSSQKAQSSNNIHGENLQVSPSVLGSQEIELPIIYNHQQQKQKQQQQKAQNNKNVQQSNQKEKNKANDYPIQNSQNDHIQEEIQKGESSKNLQQDLLQKQKQIQDEQILNRPIQILDQVIYPPIPPHFYLPQFDQKYGYLFRKLVYIKNWKEMNRKRLNPMTTQQLNYRNTNNWTVPNAPMPLNFMNGNLNTFNPNDLIPTGAESMIMNLNKNKED